MAYSGITTYGDTTVYHWSLTDETPELMARQCEELGLPSQVEARAPSRRREILAERLLLHRIAREGKVELLHDEDRAPHVPQLEGHLSIAHTRSELLIALNVAHPIGIDLEGYRERVLNVRDAFLSEGERGWIAAGDLRAHVVAWTAKEAIFKAISKRSLVKSYRDDIVLLPFELSASTTRLHHEARFGDMAFALTTHLQPDAAFTLAVLVTSH